MFNHIYNYLFTYYKDEKIISKDVFFFGGLAISFLNIDDRCLLKAFLF